MEGDIGGGLTIQRRISIFELDPTVVHIDSCILAHSVGEGSGGFSRFYALSVNENKCIHHYVDL